ncbi:hypothetical protein MYX07_04200 [Patescibacteria group bacterium AH-259-L07]|nr:hypothetical protein [Patescibacteria group bacterium AH-259-L07]
MKKREQINPRELGTRKIRRAFETDEPLPIRRRRNLLDPEKTRETLKDVKKYRHSDKEGGE